MTTQIICKCLPGSGREAAGATAMLWWVALGSQAGHSAGRVSRGGRASPAATQPVSIAAEVPATSSARCACSAGCADPGGLLG